MKTDELKCVTCNEEIRPQIKLVFTRDGNKYEVIDTYGFTWRCGDEDWSDYYWTDGNGSCDDNRSRIIHENFPEFPEIEQCGDTIELESLEFLEDKMVCKCNRP